VLIGANWEWDGIHGGFLAMKKGSFMADLRTFFSGNVMGIFHHQ
jgi:hypothetical protein